MDDFVEVVFTEDTRVVAGAYIVGFKAGVARKVNGMLAQKALGMGAKPATTKPAKPAKPARTLREVPAEPVESVPLGETVADDPQPKRRGRPRTKPKKSRPEIADVAEYIYANQPKWNDENNYDRNGLPRMSLFAEAFPDLTASQRDAAWDAFVIRQRKS